MNIRFGWGPKISAQFAVVVLPLATLLFVQAWLDLRRSTQLSVQFPTHLAASAARKTYKQFVNGLSDAVDTGKLSAQSVAALHQAIEPLQDIARRTQAPDAIRLVDDIQSLSAKVSEQASLQQLLPLRAQITAVNEAIEHLDQQYETQTRSEIAAAQAGARQQLATVLVAAAVALALSILFVRTMIARLTTPLKDGIRIAQAIALGDLSASRAVSGRDETAQLLNALSAMTVSLREIVGQVRSSSDGIRAASTEIATGNRDLSERTDNAARSLQRTASGVEQINQAVSQNAAHASQANAAASVATDVARKGGEVIGQVVSTMGEIESSSRKISDIVGVIDSISFQTNILALNAAVEAARAGEQGRGFAVVASEVRALAHRSATAAREVRSLIKESVDKVQSGSSLVVNAGQTMDEIVQHVRRLSDLIAQIHAASSAQASEIGQLHGSIGELDQMTQQNSALVEQSAAASESMTTLAVSLNQAVSRFRLEGEVVHAERG